MNVFGVDPTLYSGEMATVPTADSQTQASFGTVPPQLGSYDWTIQLQGWQLGDGKAQVEGGQNVWSTVEMSYPYMLLTQQDAFNVYSAIPGSVEYSIASAATASSGTAIFNDTSAISWSIPCSAVSQVSFKVTVGEVTITVPSDQLFTTIGGACVGNIKGWADSTRTTYILGSAFMGSAYIVYTAFPDTQSNTIGFANRLFLTKSNKEVGPIVGGVVGGLGFLGLIALLAFLFIRRRRQRNISPSASYLASGGAPSNSTTKEKGMFRWGSSKKEPNDELLVPEPWSANRSQEGSGVTIIPWSPAAPSEQAFLSPTGSFNSQQPSSPIDQPMVRERASSFTMTMVSTPPIPTPPPVGAMPPLSPGFYREQQSLDRQGYSPVPSSNPVMWVERSS